MLHATGMPLPLGDRVVTSARNFADGSVEDTKLQKGSFLKQHTKQLKKCIGKDSS